MDSWWEHLYSQEELTMSKVYSKINKDELLNGKDVKKALPSKFKQSDGIP